MNEGHLNFCLWGKVDYIFFIFKQIVCLPPYNFNLFNIYLILLVFFLNSTLLVCIIKSSNTVCPRKEKEKNCLPISECLNEYLHSYLTILCGVSAQTVVVRIY